MATKLHLYRVIRKYILTFSEKANLLSGIAACLRSRPLLPLSDDQSDLNFLSTAHFLIRRKSYLISKPDYSNEEIATGRPWQLISQRAQLFWSR